MIPKKKKPDLKFNELEYSHDLCDELIDFCSSGSSFECFCFEKRIAMRIFERWVNEYPEFNDALNVAISGTLYYWEKRLMSAISSIEPDPAVINSIKFMISMNASVYNEKLRKGASEIKDKTSKFTVTPESPGSTFLEGILD